MKTFTTFMEDLASGRPMKKPVSSNLLQQRAKENTKALKSGFMKLTKQERDKEARRMSEAKDMCSCNCDCGKAICESCGKPKMQKESARDNYNPEISDKRTKEKLKKAGLPPESPKVMETILRDIFEGKKKGMDGKACWKGYKLQGTKKKGNRTVDNCVPVSEGMKSYHTMNPTSHVKKEGNKFCVYDMKDKKVASFDSKSEADAYAKKNHDALMNEAKKPVVHSTKPDSLKMVKIKYNKPIKTKVTDIGPGGKETVRKDWSESVLDRDPKSNSFNRTKAKKTKVKVGTKSGKTVYGTTTTPQGFPGLREHQMQLVTNLDFNESLGNLVTRGLDKVRASIKDAEKRTGYKVDPSKNKHSNPVSGKNIAKRLASQKKR